ncbi:hypothetical protein ANN_02326 [Periplaneta americana]|uniref:Uncharacterized protein n=1 Tax=Periplaneta americana TaxID=6978 RepID=A0ABQ8TX31_PERAM|nr:hypothetical protein ANN_02326 [Periplaneta americana]
MAALCEGGNKPLGSLKANGARAYVSYLAYADTTNNLVVVYLKRNFPCLARDADRNTPGRRTVTVASESEPEQIGVQIEFPQRK